MSLSSLTCDVIPGQRHSMLFLIALFVTFSHGEVSRSAAVSNNSCMTDWLIDAGIPTSKVGLYEGKFREGNVQISKLKHFSPYILRLLGITSEKHQKRILDCASEQCSRPCRNGGVCSASGGVYQCHCPIRFTYRGDRCDFDLCDPNPCVYGGTRSGTCEHNATSGFVCNCTPGYEGKRCHRMIDKCDPNPCSNGATCTGLLNDFHCSCGPHHHGRVCKHQWISRADYERLKGRSEQTRKNLEKFKAFVLALNGWKRRGTCVYKAFMEKKAFFNDAESSCRSFEGHLASIHSLDEQQFIDNQVIPTTARHTWIGGSDRNVEGSWEWTDGTPMDYFHWAKNEPNDDVHPEDEDCLEIKKLPFPGWNDYPCSHEREWSDSYVCKVCF